MLGDTEHLHYVLRETVVRRVPSERELKGQGCGPGRKAGRYRTCTGRGRYRMGWALVLGGTKVRARKEAKKMGKQ